MSIFLKKGGKNEKMILQQTKDSTGSKKPNQNLQNNQNIDFSSVLGEYLAKNYIKPIKSKPNSFLTQDNHKITLEQLLNSISFEGFKDGFEGNYHKYLVSPNLTKLYQKYSKSLFSNKDAKNFILSQFEYNREFWKGRAAATSLPYNLVLN